MVQKKRRELEARLEELRKEQKVVEQQLEQLHHGERLHTFDEIALALEQHIDRFTDDQRAELMQIIKVGRINWSGSGHVPKLFKEWEKTAEGKAFRKKNPGRRASPLLKDKKNT